MIYEIVKYDMLDKNIYLIKERPELTKQEGKNGEASKFLDEDGKVEFCRPDTQFTDTLVFYKKSVLGFDDVYSEKQHPEFLPYFADVTEDLPGSCKFEPETYENCQLLTQKHGSYLEFFHHETKKTLRIAINSNTYSPCVVTS